MAKRKPGPSVADFPAPFGAWGRRLGFRWVFPVGTLPVPFHPLVLPLALGLILGWALRAAAAAVIGVAVGETTWAALLIIAALLGGLMSLPVIVWFIAPLGGQLVQAVLILAAMVLVAIEVWQGRVPVAWATLPAGYALLFVAQAGLGRPFLRRLRGERLAFVPQSPGQIDVALAEFEHFAADFIKQRDLPRLYCPASRGTYKAKQYHWLAPSDAAALLAAWGGEPPREWKFETMTGGTLLSREGARPAWPAIRLRQGRYRAPLWLVTGLSRAEARGAGRRWRLVYGHAKTVRPIPLANLFHFTSLYGKGSSHWVAGFPRGKPEDLPPPECDNGKQLWELFVRRPEDGGTHDIAALPQLFAEIEATLAERAATRARAIANIPAFWQSLETQPRPRGANFETLGALYDDPALLRAENVTATLDWFEHSRDSRSMVSLVAAARLLETFPVALLEPLVERIEGIFGSAMLALQWRIHEVTDRKKVPDGAPIFVGSIAGYGLYLSKPGLYRKLALLSPRLARIADKLERRMESDEPGLAKSFTFVVSDQGAIG